jgi:hypothetical protein
MVPGIASDVRIGSGGRRGIEAAGEQQCNQAGGETHDNLPIEPEGLIKSSLPPFLANDVKLPI